MESRFDGTHDHDHIDTDWLLMLSQSIEKIFQKRRQNIWFKNLSSRQ